MTKKIKTIIVEMEINKLEKARFLYFFCFEKRNKALAENTALAQPFNYDSQNHPDFEKRDEALVKRDEIWSKKKEIKKNNPIPEHPDLSLPVLKYLKGFLTVIFFGGIIYYFV